MTAGTGCGELPFRLQVEPVTRQFTVTVRFSSVHQQLKQLRANGSGNNLEMLSLSSATVTISWGRSGSVR
jgi:carbon monoxide dehydrogenase subunit G